MSRIQRQVGTEVEFVCELKDRWLGCFHLITKKACSCGVPLGEMALKGKISPPIFERCAPSFAPQPTGHSECAGRMYMPRADFQRLNEQRAAKGKASLPTPVMPLQDPSGSSIQISLPAAALTSSCTPSTWRVGLGRIWMLSTSSGVGVPHQSSRQALPGARRNRGIHSSLDSTPG